MTYGVCGFLCSALRQSPLLLSLLVILLTSVLDEDVCAAAERGLLRLLRVHFIDFISSSFQLCQLTLKTVLLCGLNWVYQHL